MDQHDADVLVVGGGPAGLITTLLLAQQGVRVHCITKHPGISQQPRARGIHARAVEILRQCGVEADMRAAELQIAPRLEVRPNLGSPAIGGTDTGGPALAEISPCDMGYSYSTAGTAAPNGTADPAPALSGPYRPTAHPGARAPHLWLSESGRRSTLDLFGHGFALLTGPAGGVWHTASALVTQTGLPFAGNCGGWRPYAAVRKVPLSVTTITAPEFASAYELSGQGAVLIRPDGHVANRWHPLRPSLDIAIATRLLASALSAATGHPPAHPHSPLHLPATSAAGAR